MENWFIWLLFAAVVVGYVRMCLYPDDATRFQRFIFWPWLLGPKTPKPPHPPK